MIVVSLTYKVPLDVLDLHVAAHMDWLREAYAAGHLLASGRKVPRTGGLFLVRGDMAFARSLAASDPFAVNDLADYDFTEVNITTTAAGLEGLKSEG